MPSGLIKSALHSDVLQYNVVKFSVL